MRVRNIIRISLVALVVAGTLFAFSSFARTNSESESCKESMEDCSSTPAKKDKMGWEDLSRQFFSSL